MAATERLRALIQDAIHQRNYRSALFFADKLVSLSPDSPADVLVLAEVYYLNNEHVLSLQSKSPSHNRLVRFARCLHLLSKHKLVPVNQQARYLAAQCLVETKKWDECIHLLSDELPQKLQDKKMEAALCVLRAKSFYGLENRTRACFWLKQALSLDPLACEAFEMLVEGFMLTTDEEAELLSTLDFGEDAWLFDVYAARLKKYDLGKEAMDDGNRLLGVDISLQKAEALFYQGSFQRCYELTTKVIEADPYNHDKRLISLHASVQVELGLKNQLFYYAHKLVDECPGLAVSWYAVGCYYYLINKYDPARRFFSKATHIDSQLGPAWLAFGHSFASQGEHDQAMSAYRSAARLLQGSHLPPLCVGMELVRVHNLNLAAQFVQQAKAICDSDPLVYNELGVIAYKQRSYKQAVECFRGALNLCGGNNEMWEATVMNLGHAYLKLGDHAAAQEQYEAALSMSATPGAYIYSSLGLALHLQGKLDEAIDRYHQALSVKPEDNFATEMLTAAMDEALSLPALAAM